MGELFAEVARDRKAYPPGLSAAQLRPAPLGQGEGLGAASAEVVRQSDLGVERDGRNRIGAAHSRREQGNGIAQQVHVGIVLGEDAIGRPRHDPHLLSLTRSTTRFDHS